MRVESCSKASCEAIPIPPAPDPEIKGGFKFGAQDLNRYQECGNPGLDPERRDSPEMNREWRAPAVVVLLGSRSLRRLPPAAFL